MIKIKHLKIYLAGKMGGLTLEEMVGWRKELKSKLLEKAQEYGVDLEVVNPIDYYNFEEVRYQSQEEIEDYDLAHVTSSDIVVVNLDGLSTSEGTKIEMHDAKYHNKIPVIAFGDRKLYEDLYPWHQRNITRIEDDIDGVVKYITDFYIL